MKVLDAGTKTLSDHEVLTFITTLEASHAAEDAAAKSTGQTVFPRPKNYLLSLKRHKDHLSDPERPFANNAHYDADGEHILKLMEALEPKVQLTKTELLMIVNHRPYRRELLLPIIEDVESRYSDEVQEWIVERVAEVLGSPGTAGGEEQAGEGQAGAGADTIMADG